MRHCCGQYLKIQTIIVFRDNKASRKERQDTLKMSVHCLSPKKGIIFLFILLLKSHLTEESGYNCSKFHNLVGKPLEECPPAKFMLTDHLVECFDNTTRQEDVRGRFQRLSFSVLGQKKLCCPSNLL